MEWRQNKHIISISVAVEQSFLSRRQAAAERNETSSIRRKIPALGRHTSHRARTYCHVFGDVRDL
jgi:hypothetical protein